jgi:hypothetical protein
MTFAAASQVVRLEASAEDAIGCKLFSNELSLIAVRRGSRNLAT